MSKPNHQPASPAGRVERARGIVLTRRGFVLLASSCFATAPYIDAGAQDREAPEAIELSRFMRISRVLTGVDDPGDGSVGGQYLAALLGRPDAARALAALWQRGRFEGPDAAVSVADLAVRGVYDEPELRALADTITGNWYSGMYIAPDGEQRVATYTDALAWRTLGYRSAGPSACGGAFDHWADKPPGF